MTLSFIIVCIIAPAIFWIGYLYYKDRYRPEPIIVMGSLYLLGFGFAYLCFRAYGLLPLVGIPADPSSLIETSKPMFLCYCIFVVGILEEGFKFLPFLYCARTFKSFNEVIDGIIYSSTIALGFASYENLHHLKVLDGFELYGRAIASPLLHTMFSSIWGYIFARSFFKKRSLLIPVLFALGLSALSHGLFDFFTLSPVLRMFSVALILVIWIWRIRLTEKLNKMEKEKRE